MGETSSRSFCLAWHRTFQAVDIVHLVQQRLRDSKDLGKVEFANSACVGVAIFPDHALDEVELWKNADFALNTAKKTSRGSAISFMPSMRQGAIRKTQAEADIRRALADNKIFPFYQPKVSGSSGELVGLEALLRWEHPTKGLQLPGAIAELLDDGDLGRVLGERIVDQVLDDIVRWAKCGVCFGKVFVNASAVHLRASGYAGSIISRMANAEVSSACFGIELTETGFFRLRDGGIISRNAKLSDAGISIVLDDFGNRI